MRCASGRSANVQDRALVSFREVVLRLVRPLYIGCVLNKLRLGSFTVKLGFVCSTRSGIMSFPLHPKKKGPLLPD